MRKLRRWIGKQAWQIWPNSVRCSDEERCLELARQMLDQEANPSDSAYVLKHVEGCYQCYENYNVEKEIRSAVKRKTRNLTIPQDVVKQIKNKIMAK